MWDWVDTDDKKESWLRKAEVHEQRLAAIAELDANLAYDQDGNTNLANIDAIRTFIQKGPRDMAVSIAEGMLIAHREYYTLNQKLYSELAAQQ